MKNTTLIVVFLFLAYVVHAQVGIPTCGIDFYYDNAGNRIVRQLCYMTSSLNKDDEAYIESRSNSATVEDIAEWVVFPNPTNGFIHIKSKGISSHALVEIVNASGQSVRESRLGDGRLNLQDLLVGTYILLVKDDEKVYSTKIIKSAQ